MTEQEREQVILRYFRAWLEQDAALMEGIFDPSVVYSESWGPEYRGIEKVRFWFNEWNSRARVLQWDTRQFIHQGLVTAVEWRFRNKYISGDEEHFDGVSIFEFLPEGRIRAVREFGSKLPHYDPYAQAKRNSGKGMWMVEKA